MNENAAPMIHTTRMKPLNDGGGSIAIPAANRSPLPFPKIVYHKAQPEKRVHSQEELDAAIADGYNAEPAKKK